MLDTHKDTPRARTATSTNVSLTSLGDNALRVRLSERLGGTLALNIALVYGRGREGAIGRRDTSAGVSEIRRGGREGHQR